MTANRTRLFPTVDFEQSRPKISFDISAFAGKNVELQLLLAADYGIIDSSAFEPAPVQFTNVSPSNNSLMMSWSAGTGPYLIQEKFSLADTKWIDVLTTSNMTATVDRVGQTGFFRISDHATNSVSELTELTVSLTKSPQRGALLACLFGFRFFHTVIPRGSALVVGTKSNFPMSPEEFRQQLCKHKRLARELIVERGDAGCEPITKISGAPWWPAGLRRPMCGVGHLMSFMAQIRLSDVPTFESEDDTLISFHYCQQCAYDGTMSFGWNCSSNTSGYSVSVISEPAQKRATDSAPSQKS